MKNLFKVFTNALRRKLYIYIEGTNERLAYHYIDGLYIETITRRQPTIAEVKKFIKNGYISD